MPISRRTFLSTTTQLGVGTSLTLGFPHIVSAGAWKIPPSDQLNVGVIGPRGRGFRVLKQHLDLGGINCLSLCDVDEGVLDEKVADLQKNL